MKHGSMANIVFKSPKGGSETYEDTNASKTSKLGRGNRNSMIEISKFKQLDKTRNRVASMNTESFISIKRSAIPDETDISSSMSHIDFKQFNYPSGLE
jgi:hypothetical protein